MTNSRSIGELKLLSRLKLSGVWPTAVLTALVVMAMKVVYSMVSIRFLGGSTISSLLMGLVIVLIMDLLLQVFYGGAFFAFLNLSRGRTFSAGNVFATLKMQPDRFLIKGLILDIGAFIYVGPILYASVSDKVSIEAFFMILIIWGIIGGILYTFFRIKLSMVPFLLLDHPEMGALEAVRESIELMRGVTGKMFLLLISYIGWGILILLTMGVGTLWILPYFTETLAFFYRDRINDPDDVHEETEPDRMQYFR